MPLQNSTHPLTTFICWRIPAWSSRQKVILAIALWNIIEFFLSVFEPLYLYPRPTTLRSFSQSLGGPIRPFINAVECGWRHRRNLYPVEESVHFLVQEILYLFCSCWSCIFCFKQWEKMEELEVQEIPLEKEPVLSQLLKTVLFQSISLVTLLSLLVSLFAI